LDKKQRQAQIKLEGASLERLIRVLGNPSQDYYSRDAALDLLLTDEDPRAIEAVSEFISGEAKHEDLRLRAILDAGRRKRRECVTALLSALESDRRAVRRYAARALGSIGDERAYDALVSMLSHSDVETQSAIFEALAELGDALALPVMLAILEDADIEARVRGFAASALGTLTRKRVLTALAEASVDEASVLSFAATRGLTEITGRSLPRPKSLRHPSFILDPSIHTDTDEEVEASFRAYQEYLESIKDKLPAGAAYYASNIWPAGTLDHGHPHDAAFEKVRWEVSASGDHEDIRPQHLHLRLLGPYHDGYIEFHYKDVHDCTLTAALEWMYDEVRLSEEGRVVHEIRFDADNYWLIECADFTYEWKPFGVDRQPLTDTGH
jgi:hypothetical protein